MRNLLPIFFAAAIMVALIGLDIAKPLGAHPWWSQKTLLIGGPIGLIFAMFVVGVSVPTKRLAVFALLIVVAFAIAKYGQTQFAASYAEDVFAGKLWYFGWISVGAAAAATLTTVVQAIQRFRNR